MTRDQALDLIKVEISSENLIKHSLAVETVMRSLARRFGEDEEKWGITGLVHDLDYMKTMENPMEHSLLASLMLEEKGFPDDIIYAVKVHNEIHKLPRKSFLDKALYACDPLTGLIIACALITLEKKLDFVNTDFVLKRFNEKAFAKGASRDQIASCKEMDLSLEEFVSIGLEAMQSIDRDLGL